MDAKFRLESSFQRCEKNGLQRENPISDLLMNEKSLKELKKDNSILIDESMPVLKNLHPYLVSAGHVAILSDHKGNILLSLGEPKSLTKMQKYFLQPGSNWNEETKGTNAIGTAIIEKRSIRVHGGEHFLMQNEMITCSASPILSESQEIIGIIDISGVCHSEIPYALALTSMAAEAISNRLIVKAFRQKSSSTPKIFYLPNQIPIGETKSFPLGIYAECEPMQKCLRLASKVAPTNHTVLLEGETGTGKEEFAKFIHQKSQRSMESFIAINCGSVPEALIESELFGYSGGAFTGASVKGNIGKFQIAAKGTLFLDEICSMSLRMQAALLRAVQEKKISPVGSNKEIPTNVRIIAAANQDLNEMVKQGKFRSDLYYRLKGITISIPPLRERTDLKGLILDVLKDLDENSYSIDEEAIELLKTYDFPGNIRELQSILLQASFQTDDFLITGATISALLESKETSHFSKSSCEISTHSLEDLEKEKILKVLKLFNGNHSKASKELNIGRSTLYRKLKKYDLL
jgi:sigma-54 dependent transcriptional regulator, acetoin dehydrogenase operon transcriptional activator AcoR